MGWVENASPELNSLSEYPTIITICVILTLLSLVVVGTRLQIRHKARGLVTDDYMVILSEIFVIAYAGLCIGREYSQSLNKCLKCMSSILIGCHLFDRNKIWLGSTISRPSETKPRPLHETQLCWTTDIPNRNQLLQNCSSIKLPPPARRHEPEDISDDCLGCHYVGVPWTCRMCSVPHFCMQSCESLLNKTSSIRGT